MQDDLVEDGKASSASHVGSHKFVDYEYLVSEAKRLTIRQMAVETLVNIFTIYEKDGKFPPIRYAIHDLSAPRNVVFQIDESKHDIVERGQAYGCDEKSAKLVYSYLFDEDLISFRPKGSNLSWSITSRGLSIIDELQNGKSALLKRCFVVRKYDRDLDQMLNNVFRQVEEALKIEVRPVWAEHHNEKLDERIFRSIEESSVILVDVDPTRYNVGLEHGYAMGLGKPVIVMMQKDRYYGKRGQNLGLNLRSIPFDICTQNCELYTREKAESGELADILSARISIALNSSRR